jgi:heptosyltransferase-1
MAEFRILVLRLSSMGDVIHTLPAVASLKHSFPRSRVTWLIRPRWTALLENNPYVDEVIPLERSVSASVAEAGRLRARHYDLAVDFQGLMQTALLGVLVRPNKLVGFARRQVRESLAALAYSSQITTRAPHIVEQNLELTAGAGASNILRSFPLPEGSPEGILPEGKFVLACPFAGWGSKQWPLEYWSQLAGMLEMPLVVNGPPDSIETLEQIPGAQVHVSGIGGLIHATRRAHAVIGVDSGPLHLAAALAKPGVAIYGPTDPARNGPYGASFRVLRDENATTDYKRGVHSAASMRAISPEMVAESLAHVLEGCAA